MDTSRTPRRALAARFALAGLLALSHTAQAGDTGPHWAYKGAHDPAHWAEMDPAFETCARGTHQSPIDIRATEKVALPALEFSYASVAPSIVNNGHTIQVNVPAGQQLRIADQTYELKQFHFHTPSEEALGGKRKPMVAHFVHRNEAGQLAVVAVLFEVGASNAAFQPVFSHLPARAGETLSVADLTLDLAALLPGDRRYYSFEGSLTTPPCSEGVSWMVLKQPVKLSSAQVKAFRRLYNANARPLQPVNGRPVKESL